MKKEFKKYGDDFKQIEKKDDWYIYIRSHQSVDNPSETISHYEVVRAIKRTGSLPNGKARASAWGYPSESAWGIHGFTVATLERAYNKIKEMTDERN